MKKYTEMKFDGDLSFLNEHLEEAEALKASEDIEKENAKKETVVQFEKTILDKNYFENNKNFTYTHTSQISGNAQSDLNLKNPYLDFYNNYKKIDENKNSDSLAQSEKLETHNNTKSTINFDVEDTIAVQEEIDEKLKTVSHFDVEDAIAVQEEIDKKLETVSHLDVEDTIAVQEEIDEKLETVSHFDVEDTIAVQEEIDEKLETDTVNDFEVVQPSNRRKSQLEIMLINAGFDMELFNDFRDELLELEKDNIIMKYKQDLMMMILKS